MFIINVVGDKQSGKTRCINSLIGKKRRGNGNDFRKSYYRRLTIKNKELALNKIDILFYDPDGYNFPHYYGWKHKECLIYLYCVDLSKPIDEEKIETDIAYFQPFHGASTPSILVGTKADEMLSDNQALFDNIILKDTRSDYRAITSSKSGDGIAELRSLLIEHACINKQSLLSFPDGYLHINSLLRKEVTQYLNKNMLTLNVGILTNQYLTASHNTIKSFSHSNGTAIRNIRLRGCYIDMDDDDDDDDYLLKRTIEKSDVCYYYVDLSKLFDQFDQDKIISNFAKFEAYRTTHCPIILMGINSDHATDHQIAIFEKIRLKKAYKKIVSTKNSLTEIADEINWLIDYAQSLIHCTIPENPLYFDYTARQWKSIDEHTQLYLFKVEKSSEWGKDTYFIRHITDYPYNAPDISKEVSHYKSIDTGLLLRHRTDQTLFPEGRLTIDMLDKIPELTDLHVPFQYFIGKRTALYLLKKINLSGKSEYFIRSGKPEYFIREEPERLDPKRLPEGITHYMPINTAHLFTQYADPFLFPHGTLRMESLSEEEVRQYLHPDDELLAMKQCKDDVYLLKKNQHIYLLIKPSDQEGHEYFLRLIKGKINNTCNIPKGVIYYMQISSDYFLEEQRLKELFFPNSYLREEAISRSEAIQCLNEREREQPLQWINFPYYYLYTAPTFSELDPARLPGDGYYPSIKEGIARYGTTKQYHKIEEKMRFFKAQKSLPEDSILNPEEAAGFYSTPS